MIAPLRPPSKYTAPVSAVSEFRTESDVEQKFIFPFLTHPSYLGLPTSWIRTKEYMSPTEIDKIAGKRFGYFPDYSVWVSGIPLLIVEAKTPDVSIEAALREARLYAVEINKRYPPHVNPIGFILACNGEQLALTEWDSETSAVIFRSIDAAPGSTVLKVFQDTIGKAPIEEKAKQLVAHFQSRPFYSVTSFMGGQASINKQLGVNEFAEPLFPTLTKYFGSASDETPDEVIDRAYVTSDELGRYEGVLETYLKDRSYQLAGNQLKPIVTSRHTATGISTEVQRFAVNPTFYSRVQLIVGAVGAGKSTFIHRFYRRLMSSEVRAKTRWAFLNFNVFPPQEGLQNWISDRFITSFSDINDIDVYDFDQMSKIFSRELNQFDRGPYKHLKKVDPNEFERRRASFLDELSRNKTEFAKCIARHFSGEKGFGIVVVFDNVDKRSRDLQLAIFEAAQWFKDLTRALVLVNLRDSTFEAHRDEPPLDAFANAINFYVQPPRFAQVIRKRLELVLEVLPREVAQQQEYALSTGQRIKYPASRLGTFLMTIYLSLFDQPSLKVASAMEALVAKDVRRALGMFADILVSPHIPTSLITGTMLSGGVNRIPEFQIIRSLMRQRYKFYNGKSNYIRNIMDVNLKHNRPSNLLYADILEFMIRNRKLKIDFAQEGYAAVSTIIKKMSAAGYDEEDVLSAIKVLIEWGLIEPESLIADKISVDDAVRVHAIGFIHMRFFVERSEYLVGVTTDMKFTSRQTAEEIGSIWAGQGQFPDLNRSAKIKIFDRLKTYIEQEYSRRCKRHAFYEEVGLGGRLLVAALDRAWGHLHSERPATAARR